MTEGLEVAAAARAAAAPRLSQGTSPAAYRRVTRKTDDCTEELEEQDMTTGMRTEYGYRYNEKDYVINERFYPGEFGLVIILGIASLLLWAVSIYGITNEPQSKTDMTASANNATNAY